MHIPVPARRFPSLYVLVLACFTVLGGCSVLDGRKATTAAARGGMEEPAPHWENPETAKAEPGSTQPSAPTWSLSALQALDTTQESNGLTLEEAWRLAVEHDAEFRAAVSDRAASQTEIRQGRAALLPQIQAGYSRSKITGMQRHFASGTVREADLDYDSTSAYIQLQQPLFNVERYAQFQRGTARAQLGEAEFSMQEYEAAMRLATAFLEVITAEGRYALNASLADSLEEQATTQDALYERNEGDRVDAQETRARLAIAQADVIAAEDALKVARRQLQAYIGREPPPLTHIDDVDPALLPVQGGLIDWLSRAQASGSPVRVAEAQVQVAGTEVRRAAARHLPTADLVVSLIDADSENLDSLSQRSNTFQVGVQVAIPIFSGGYNTANHARSRHELQQAEHELAQAREQVAAEVTRQYNAVQSSAQRIEALISSVRSAEESLNAARKGYEYGINSNLDVLRRQDNLFQARHELLSARALWLQARVALSAVSGEPITRVFAELDALVSN